MPLDAFLLAFGAAWIHAASNVYLGRRGEPEAAMAVMLIVGVAGYAPLAAWTWRVHEAAIPYIAASACLELGYFGFLAAGYRASSVSLVYPIARGSAPVLVLAGSALFLAQAASGWQIAGVATVAVGILLVRGIRVALAAADARGFLLALITGVFIAGYTLVDKEGLRHAGPVPYIELVLVGPAIIYALFVTRLRGAASLRRELSLKVGAVGLLLFGTYVIVLLALRLAPAASVSAVRESSVVIASGIAALVAKERVGARRFAGAVLVAAGIALVAFSG